MTEEDRHADEVNIAFQMGAEWQKKQSDSAWKGIHEGAVLAMQARITELEGELNAITDDAVARVFELEDRIEKLEAALWKIVVREHQAEIVSKLAEELSDIARIALEEKDD